MKTIKTLTTLLVTSSVFALDVTAHANFTDLHGQSLGIGAANVFDIDENSPVSIELASSINFGTGSENCCKPSAFIVASAKIDFSWSDYESITIGQRFQISGSQGIDGMSNINNGMCIGYKRKFDDKTVEISLFEAGREDTGISFTAGKTLDQE